MVRTKFIAILINADYVTKHPFDFMETLLKLLDISNVTKRDMKANHVRSLQE